MVNFLHQTIEGWSSDNLTLIAALQSPQGAHLFHGLASDFSDLEFGVSDEALQTLNFSGAFEHIISGADGAVLTANLGGQAISIPLQPAQTDLFEDKNCLLGIRNHETAQNVADWLAFHARHQGAQAALILDRANDRGFYKRLKKAAQDCGLDTVVVLNMTAALGQVDLPDEGHPFCCPTAPGKDRMEIPKPDPQRSPLGVQSVFEIMRIAFLNTARSVLSLDVSDLLPETSGRVFDLAQTSDIGVVPLHGELVFPWRVRSGQECTFADHIYGQFDSGQRARRWCVAPAKTRDCFWRYVRIAGPDTRDMPHLPFFRFMGLRHPGQTVSKIVPKSSLAPHPEVRSLMQSESDHKPVEMPKKKLPKFDQGQNKTAIVTTMKNEGPFILEWIAYHRVIGVEGFLVYTNDCNDGTDTFLELLQDKGIVQHRDNPFKGTDLKPQHAALQAAESEDTITQADWVICMDVDEYINIKVGDGHLDDLYKAIGDANMISCTWRLFGNADVHEFDDDPIIGQFDRCAEEFTRKPHQAWGFKTLFRNVGIFKKLGVHRPKGLNPQLWEQINWVNGSGKAMPPTDYRNAWRSTADTYGYDLVSLNHYAVRSAESFLVKRDRGRVNHVDRDQGLAYWFRMNNNSVEETTIQRMIPAVRAEMDRLLSDPDIAKAHAGCVDAHRQKIEELKATERFSKFYDDLCSDRLQRMSRMHQYFGAKVFLGGPEVVPDEVVFQDHDDDFFFTVDDVETTH